MHRVLFGVRDNLFVHLAVIHWHHDRRVASETGHIYADDFLAWSSLPFLFGPLFFEGTFDIGELDQRVVTLFREYGQDTGLKHWRLCTPRLGTLECPQWCDEFRVGQWQNEELLSRVTHEVGEVLDSV